MGSHFLSSGLIFTIAISHHTTQRLIYHCHCILHLQPFIYHHLQYSPLSQKSHTHLGRLHRDMRGRPRCAKRTNTPTKCPQTTPNKNRLLHCGFSNFNVRNSQPLPTKAPTNPERHILGWLLKQIKSPKYPQLPTK